VGTAAARAPSSRRDRREFWRARGGGGGLAVPWKCSAGAGALEHHRNRVGNGQWQPKLDARGLVLLVAGRKKLHAAVSSGGPVAITTHVCASSRDVVDETDGLRPRSATCSRPSRRPGG
jgi:hypothetical protein